MPTDYLSSDPIPASFAILVEAAFHAERVAARRLAAATGLDEAAALRHTLQQAAGAGGIDGLLAARARRRQADADRRSAKMLAREQAQAARRAARQPQLHAPAGTWHGWFDGSAHPNPGRLGIGALLLGPEGQRVEISRRAGHGNSGEAEYLALEALLQAAAAARPARLALYGDSQVVIGDVNAGRDADFAAGVAPGAAGLARHRARVLALLAQLDHVALHWVPRHRNADADRLSQQAIAAWRRLEDEAQEKPRLA